MSKFDFGKLGFDRINFLKRHELDETFTDKILIDVKNKETKIKNEIEKVLCFICDNTANNARTSYPGIDI
ncbi:MAG: hypothetical protein PHC34_11810 [Candidatus Gastranaerophilales bacterium]|nr:hypothetical protein [Candidatus Gastranaerophilales bacterium]